MTIEVRAGAPGDTDVIAHFQQQMARETEGKDLDRETVVSGVTAVFDDDSRGRYVVAHHEGTVVGVLLLTFEWSDWRDGAFWWIQSVYVEPRFRREGVFRAMYRAVVDDAKKRGNVRGIRLYVDRTNETAHRAYLSLGMSRTGYEVFEEDFGDR